MNFACTPTQARVDLASTLKPTPNILFLFLFGHSTLNWDLLTQLRNLDHLDQQDIIEINTNSLVQLDANYTTPKLTVWRYLHLEIDSMRDTLLVKMKYVVIFKILQV